MGTGLIQDGLGGSFTGATFGCYTETITELQHVIDPARCRCNLWQHQYRPARRERARVAQRRRLCERVADRQEQVEEEDVQKVENVEIVVEGGEVEDVANQLRG